MQTLHAFLLLAVGVALTSALGDPKEPSRILYPYGTGQGDKKNPRSDDGTSPEISTAVPFTFYGKQYHTLYVNNNGVVSFGVKVSQYTPDPFPLDGGSPFVAPYWADVDNTRSGDVFWRQTQDPAVLSRCTRDINQYFPEISFTATWAFIATWERVPFYGSLSDKVNTFQAVLTTNEEIAFIFLFYDKIEWTTGIGSGGDLLTGLGGTSAQAGFDSGDKKNYYNIPGSRTPEILNIVRTSNVNVPGCWVFQVDELVGVPTVKPECLQ